MNIRELIRFFDNGRAKDVKVNGRRVLDMSREVEPGDRVTWTCRGMGWDVEVPIGMKSLAAVPA